MSNPLSLVYNALLQLSKDNTILQKYIRSGNFQALNKSQFPKDSISTADLPEIVLLATTLSGNLIASSSSSEVIVSYNWLVTSGSFDLAELTSELLWGSLTLSSAACVELPKVLWNDVPFVKNVQLVQTELALDNVQQNKGLEGWSFTWPLLVTMYFSSNELRNNQCPVP